MAVEGEKSIQELIAEQLAKKQATEFDKSGGKQPEPDSVTADLALKQQFDKHEKMVFDAHKALYESSKLTDAEIASVKEQAVTEFKKSNQKIAQLVSDLRSKDAEIQELKESFLKSKSGSDLQRSENELRKTSFQKFLKSGFGALTENERSSFSAQGFKKSADGTITTDDNFGGGFRIRIPQLLSMVEEKPDVSALETYCRREEIDSLSAMIPILKSMQMERSRWAKEAVEGKEIAETAFESIPVQLNDLYCNFRVSRQYLQDTLNPENWIVNEARLNDRRAINQDMLTGDGNAKMRGIFETIKTTRRDGFPVHVTANKGSVSLQDLKVLWSGRAVAPYRSESKWYMGTTPLAELRFEEGTNGQFKWSTDIREGIPLQLNGQPVVEVYEMPDLVSDSICLFYGDLRASYLIAENPNSYFVRDETTWAMKRIVLFIFFRFLDGKPQNTKSLHLLQVK